MFQAIARRCRSIQDNDHKLVKVAFEFADTEKNGYLNKSEFKFAYLVVFGCKPSKFDVDDILKNYGKKVSCVLTNDEDDYPVIDSETFKKIAIERLQYSDIDDDIRETFQVIDARCKGYIDFTDFKRLVMKFLPTFDSLRVRKIFNEADRDNDGRISFRDFQVLMKSDNWEPNKNQY